MDRLRRVSVTFVLALLFAFLGAFWLLAYHDPRGLRMHHETPRYHAPVPGTPTLDDDFPVQR